MKFNFKNILIIFLVGLLGGVVGTFGVIEINKATGNKILNNGSTVNISTVDYTDSAEQSDYTVAIGKAYNTVVEIQSVKTVQSIYGESEGAYAGSGVIISSDGYIVTNDHIAGSATQIEVILYNGDTYDAEVIGSDSRSDIALIKIDATDLPYAEFADSSELELGQECIAIGNSLGKGISCTNGIISVLEKEVVINGVSHTLIQTNAAINSGNSGGGLFNMNGDLIGIVNSKSSSTTTTSSSLTIEGMGYAIPSNTVQKIIKDLSDYGYVKDRATLGVGVNASYTYQTNEYTGLLVTKVYDNTGAQKAGIQEGDVITEVDGTQTTSYAILSKILNDHDIGDTVSVTIYRNNEKMTLNVTLTEGIQTNTTKE